MLSAFISLALKKAPNKRIAVTGEVDLNGSVRLKTSFSVLYIHFQIRPIGLVASKLLGAEKENIKHVIFPNGSSGIDWDKVKEWRNNHYPPPQHSLYTHIYHSNLPSGNIYLAPVQNYDQVYELLFGNTSDESMEI